MYPAVWKTPKISLLSMYGDTHRVHHPMDPLVYKSNISKFDFCPVLYRNYLICDLLQSNGD